MMLVEPCCKLSMELPKMKLLSSF